MVTKSDTSVKTNMLIRSLSDSTTPSENVGAEGFYFTFAITDYFATMNYDLPKFGKFKLA